MYKIKLYIFFLSIISCTQEVVNEKLFCIESHITEETLLERGYKIMGTTEKGNIYTNVPNGLYSFGTTARNEKQAKYVIEELNGNEVTYYFIKDKVEKREVYHYGEKHRENGFFTMESLHQLLIKENCSYKISTIDTLRFKNENIYELVLKNEQGQQHLVRLTKNSITIESYFQRDSSSNVITITPPPHQN